MASKPKAPLRLVSEAEPAVATSFEREMPFPLFSRALDGATNDEALEIGYRTWEELGRRAESVSRLALLANDRDAVNEAFVFVTLVDKVIPHSFWSIDKRSNRVWTQVRDAKERVGKAQRAQVQGAESRPSSIELSAKEQAEDESAAYAIPTFTSDQIVGALRAAMDENAKRIPHCRGAAHTAEILKQLMPGACSHRGHRPTRAALRLAQRLSKLAKAGAIVRMRPKWGNASNFWTLEGEELGEYIAKGWRRDDA